MLIKIFLILTLIYDCYSENELPLVKTPLGEVRGYHKTSLDGITYSAFEGIPYAKPPVGEKRFKESESTDPWIGIWNATIKTVCAQTDFTQPNRTFGDEDCLHINVYVPRQNPNSEEHLDVIVHIHGGGFMYGSGHMLSSPDFFMNRDVIFVNFNYRLNIFGFLSTEDDVVPGNNGLKDQVLALKWVQKNIASFGGNPDSVTLTGVSAGGSSVHFHYLSEQSKNLFHRGFSQSGLATNPFAIQKNPLMRTKILAELLGCPSNNTQILVDCLKQKPKQHFLDNISSFFVYKSIPIAPFGVVVEKSGPNPFIKEDPYILLNKGHVNDVPWLASNTLHEGLLFAMLFSEDLDYLDTNWKKFAPILVDFNFTLPESEWDSTSEKIRKFYFGDEKINQLTFLKFAQLLTDRHFLSDAETTVRLQSEKMMSPVYYYLFGYPGETSKEKVVPHGIDSIYFGNPYLPRITAPNDFKMKDILINMTVSFAKSGTPKIDNVEWKPTKFDKLTYLKLNGVELDEIKLETTEELTTRKFWKSLNFREGENLISDSKI